MSDDYHVLYERKIPTYVLVGIPTLCQISTYDSRTMSAFFVGVCMGLIIYSHYQFLGRQELLATSRFLCCGLRYLVLGFGFFGYCALTRVPIGSIGFL